MAQVGKNIAGLWNVGDTVAGLVHGSQYLDIDSFAEYLKVDGALVWKILDAIPDSHAATYGVPAVTAMLALACLDIPCEDICEGAIIQPTERSPVYTKVTPLYRRNCLDMAWASD